jgi:NADPH-dependent glutamate synthase beta subunit-like oxidoreductase
VFALGDTRVRMAAAALRAGQPPSTVDASEAAGRHVLVVGYGKSACDVTVRR